MTNANATESRVARCACAKLTATVRDEPTEVYACSCLDCQRLSGSSFTYCAVYPESAVAIAGERRAWRHRGDSGRWLENGFCPTCGVSVFFMLEVMPGAIGVNVGCFADPHFARPARVYWASRQHDWLKFPEGVRLIEAESG